MTQVLGGKVSFVSYIQRSIQSSFYRFILLTNGNFNDGEPEAQG
jgi:hypothetical protein